MDEKFMATIDDAEAVLSAESEFVLTELAAAQHLDVESRLATLEDAMKVADRYTKLLETMSEIEQKRQDAELKQKELDQKVKENSENAVQQKRTARVETIKSIGDTVIKCGLLFAQGALYVWGVHRTFEFEQFHTASTSVGRSLLNNVSNLFIKK